MKHSYQLFLVFYLVLFQFSGHSQVGSKELTDAASYTFSVYKTLHQYPELGKQEFRTASFIDSSLRAFGYTEFYPVSGLPTAVIVVLDTKRSGPVIGLRAELDARKQQEATGLLYSSQLPNRMHSCGHDAHAAILLTAAKLLYTHRASLTGKIVFVFQPAEETKGGADDIVEAGILSTLKIERMFALHCYEGLNVGVVNICPGLLMSGSNYFSVAVKGKNSHAGYPFNGSDIPLSVSQLIAELSLMPARTMQISERPCVISITYMQSGDSDGTNVLPDSAHFKGTIRSYENIDSSYKGQTSIRSLVEAVITGFEQSKKVKVTLNITKGSPPLSNDPTLYDEVLPNLRARFSGIVDTTPYKSMAAEDFAYYTPGIPCLYFSLGIAKDGLGTAGVHTSKFSVHPDAFRYGVELMTILAGLKVN